MLFLNPEMARAEQQSSLLSQFLETFAVPYDGHRS